MQQARFSYFSFRGIFPFFLLFVSLGLSALILMTDGMPSLNDIYWVLKISSLDGVGKWLNGFYGPGFTYLAEVFSPELKVFEVTYMVLVFLSAIATYYFAVNISAQIDDNRVKYIYIACGVIWLLMLLKNSINYTDGLFVLLIYIGVLLIMHGVISSSNRISQLVCGGFLLGVAVLFRHHGFVFILLLLSILIAMSIIKSVTLLRTMPDIFFMLVGFLPPVIASNFHLHSIGVLENWQVFNIYRFFFGVDWNAVPELLASDAYREFDLFPYVLNNPLNFCRFILSEFVSALKLTYLFIFVPLYFYVRTKSVPQLVYLLTTIVYIFIILPGIERGVLPLYILLIASLLSAIFAAVEINFRTFGVPLVLIAISLLGGIRSFVKFESQAFQHNSLMKLTIAPYLRSQGVSSQNEIFAEDFDIYLTGLESESFRRCGYLGWLALHPNFKDYNYRDTLFGRQTSYCDVKVAVLKDEGLVADLQRRDDFFLKSERFGPYHVFIKK
jgi:hypothetical protein